MKRQIRPSPPSGPSDAASILAERLSKNLPIDQALGLHAVIVEVLVPILNQVAVATRAKCVEAVRHVEDYPGLLHKTPDHMHRAVERAVATAKVRIVSPKLDV